MCSAFRDANYNYFGISDTWSCFRTSPEFVAKWVTLDEAATIYKDEFEMPKLLKDDRAILRSANAGSKDTCKLTGAFCYRRSWRWVLRDYVTVAFYADCKISSFEQVCKKLFRRSCKIRERVTDFRRFSRIERYRAGMKY